MTDWQKSEKLMDAVNRLAFEFENEGKAADAKAIREISQFSSSTLAKLYDAIIGED